ncbi:autotransporter outer membrane beta-barrel domain-containing protein [Pseudomonas paraveronii]|uniref:autotransporter outer membrane beta-barrel domain-containing protein n=1 Tax=Pseudomonas paraveronii TaxID=3040598 RepID=UPI002AB26DDA|nr:autotransporter outer membrane beta-barrel domain-containing protein [Pseudomonas sp. FLM 11]
MHTTDSSRFKYSRLSTAIKLIAVAPLYFMSSQAMALEDLDGKTKNVYAGDFADSFTLRNNATLNLYEGALARSVVAANSTLNMEGARVASTTAGTAVVLTNSKAQINNSLITSSVAGGLDVVRNSTTSTGSEAYLNFSEVRGATYGANVTSHSTLYLNDSKLFGGSQAGLILRGGAAEAFNSEITGATNGIRMTREHSTVPNSPQLRLEGTRVEGLAGAAIRVDTPITAEIDVNNGSTLIGSDGTMVELANSGNANMRVNSSMLAGNILVGMDSTLDLSLDRAIMNGDVINTGGNASVGLNNGSILTGRLENVDKLAINSDATWVMVDHQQVGDLSLSGGNVKFGETGTFYQLDVANLSGNGTFIMSADFATLTGDFLNVTGTSSGDHKLLIASSGADPLSDDRLHVVHTADGGAQFSLIGDRVDVGTYSYSLINENDGQDWLLDPDSKVISPSTNSVLALFNAAPTVLLGEMTTLRTRMGELRFSEGQSAGFWTRAYGNKYEVSNDKTGLGYNQSQRGFTLGADAPVAAGDGQWLIGAMVGHSTSDLDLNRGSSATVNSYYVGGYATWLDAESGFYFDGVLKFNRLHNESNVAMSDGKKAKGNYTQNAVGASAEVGRHITLDDGFFVEPYGQLAAVITQAQSYTLDNGLDAKGDRSSTVIGELGTTVGRTIQLESGGVLQPYLKAAVAHEFDQSNKVFVNDNAFNNDLSGSRLKLGAGVAMSVSQNVKLHADLEHSTGKNIKQPFGMNVGLRYDF